jgi:hypothetical protein
MSGKILVGTNVVGPSNPLPVVGATTGMPIAASTVIPTRDAPLATFSVTAQAATLTNASLLSLSLLPGTGLQAVRLIGIYIYNVQTTAVVGVNAQFELRRYSTDSLGTARTPVSYDTQNSLDAFVITKTGATIAGENINPLRTWFFNLDEILAGAASNQGVASAVMQLPPPLSPLQQAPTIRVGEGLHVKCVSTSTTGTVNVSFVFTQE